MQKNKDAMHISLCSMEVNNDEGILCVLLNEEELETTFQTEGIIHIFKAWNKNNLPFTSMNKTLMPFLSHS